MYRVVNQIRTKVSMAVFIYLLSTFKRYTINILITYEPIKYLYFKSQFKWHTSITFGHVEYNIYWVYYLSKLSVRKYISKLIRELSTLYSLQISFLIQQIVLHVMKYNLELEFLFPRRASIFYLTLRVQYHTLTYRDLNDRYIP